MAEFNPGVPETHPPEWMFWSKGIEQPHPDKSKAVAIESAGKTFDIGIKSLDHLEKTDETNQIHAGVDKERNEYTAAVKGFYDSIDKTKPPSGPPGSNQPSLLSRTPPEASPSTTDLSKLSENLSVLGDARANGKLSETAYWGRLDALAQQYRSMHPGDRDHIDKVFAETADWRPANMHLRGMISDINSWATAQRTQHDKVRDFMINHPEDFGDMAAVLKRYDNKEIDQYQVMSLAQERIKLKADTALREAQLRQKETEQKVSRDEWKQNFSRFATDYTRSAMDGATMAMFPGKTMTQIVTGAQDGTLDVDDESARKLSFALRAKRQQAVEFLTSHANKVEGPTGPQPAIAERMGGAGELNKAIDDVMKQTWDPYIESVDNKEYGIAFAHKLLNDARKNDDVNTLLTQNPILRADHAMKDAGSEFYKATVNDLYRQFNKDPNGFANLYHSMVNLGGQPDIRTGKPAFTVNNALDNAKKTKASEDPNFNKNLVDYLSKVGKDDPAMTPQVRENLAKGIYSPEARGFLTRFIQKDQSTVFNKLFNEGVNRHLKRLGDANLIQDYVDTGRSEFATFFGDHLGQFAKMQDIPDLHLSWDTESHQFHLNTKDEKNIDTYSPRLLFRSPAEQVGIYGQIKILRDLNKGIIGLNSVENMAGGSAEVQMLQRILGDPQFKGNAEEISGFPRQIVEAIAAAHTKPKAEPEGAMQGK